MRVHADRYFDNQVLERIYSGTCLMTRVFQKALDLLLPAIQICAKKEPPNASKSIFQRAKKIGLAIPGAVAVVATSPLLLVAKLLQWLIKSKMHPFVVQIAPHTPVPNARTSLKLATLNVFGLPNMVFMMGDKTNGEVARVRLPKIAEIVNRQNLDILCLQECFDKEACSLLTDTLQKSYPYILKGAGEADPFGLSSGLVVASKHPILEAEFVEFPNRLGVDKMAHKGVICVKVDLGEKRVGYIATTHMQANTPKRLPTAQTRNEQLDILQKSFEAFIKQHTQPDEAIVLKSVSGDFNFDNTRIAAAHTDRNELNQPATYALFQKTVDPIVETTAQEKPSGWQRPCDPPLCGTALKYQNLRPQNRQEELEEIEENATRRLDYMLFYRDCHTSSQKITAETGFIKSDEGEILTDHLMLSAKVAN